MTNASPDPPLDALPLPVIGPTPPLDAARAVVAENAPVAAALSPATGIDGLYVHIPFCFHKCHYCDFYSVVDGPDKDRQPAFTQALIAEARHRQTQLHAAPRTVFFGGGTPTYLRPELWARLLQTLHASGWMADAQEVTVEANPETLTAPLLDQLRSGGVNRLSMGAQSFNEQHLKTLERWHDPRKVEAAAAMAKAAGITNLSLDLIFAIPGQTVREVIEDLDRALALGPTHLSAYALIFEPGTRLTARRDRGQIAPVDEALEAEMFAAVIDHLKAAGFDQYEISNYARADGINDHRAQHNLVYWHNQNWLGLGPAAASHLNGIRWKNQASIDRYINHPQSPPITQVEQLDAEAAGGEALMLGLRLMQGMPMTRVNALVHNDLDRQQRIEHLIDLQMLAIVDDHLRLTRRGLFVGDSVLAELI